MTVVTAAILVTSACTRGGGGSESANARNANTDLQQQSLKTAIPQGPRGDIERAGVYISEALENSKQEKWNEVIANLKQVERELESAKSDKILAEKLGSEFAEMKTLVDEAIKDAQSQNSSTTSKLRQVKAGSSERKLKMSG